MSPLGSRGMSVVGLQTDAFRGSLWLLRNRSHQMERLIEATPNFRPMLYGTIYFVLLETFILTIRQIT